MQTAVCSARWRSFDVGFEVCCDVWNGRWRERLSLCLDDLLDLLGLPAQLLGRGEALPHLHEKSRHLVAAQKTCRSPLQPVQNTRLHRSCVDTNTRLLTRGGVNKNLNTMLTCLYPVYTSRVDIKLEFVFLTTWETPV